jgi:hypothetical protein
MGALVSETWSSGSLLYSMLGIVSMPRLIAEIIAFTGSCSGAPMSRGAQFFWLGDSRRWFLRIVDLDAGVAE